MAQQRRNNSIGGLGVLIGALLIGFGSLRPWATVTTAGISFKTANLDLSVVPNVSMAKGELQSSVGICAGLVALSALLLIATRVRGLGILWRLCAFAFAVVPAVLVVYLWTVALGDPAQVLDDPTASVIDRALGLGESLLQRFGLLKVAPGQGLYLMSLGLALVIIGICIPAIRSTTPIMAMGTSAPSPPGPAPGWYAGNGTQRYWDGAQWSSTSEMQGDRSTER